MPGTATVWVNCFFYGFEMPRTDFERFALRGKPLENASLPNGSEGRRALLRSSVSRVVVREKTLRRTESRPALSLDQILSLPLRQVCDEHDV